MTWRGLFRRITWTSTVLCLLGWGISVWYGAGMLVVTPVGTVEASVYRGTAGFSLAAPHGRLLPGFDVVTDVIPVRHARGMGFGGWRADAFRDGVCLYQVFSDGEMPSCYTTGTHVVLGLPVWAVWLLFSGAVFSGCRWAERRSGGDMGPSGSGGFPA